MKIGKKSWSAIAIVLLVGLAGSADARRMTMSGTWVTTNGQITIPVAAVPSASLVEVQATGSSPAAVTVPVDVVSGFQPTAFPIPVPQVQQLATSFMLQGPSTEANFAAGGGPGAFQWCPGAAVNPNCTTFVTTPGGATTAGRVAYTAGANQFGGVAQMLLQGTGAVSFVVNTAPLQVSHGPLGGTQMQVDGGPYSNIRTVVINPGVITSPVGFTPGGLITAGGPVVGTGPTGTNQDFGFPFTTGMVTVTAVTGLGTRVDMLTGSDARTPRGAGNLVLVAGGYTKNGVNNNSTNRTATLDMTFSPAIPAMSPAALALGAAGLIGVAGYAIRQGVARRR